MRPLGLACACLALAALPASGGAGMEHTLVALTVLEGGGLAGDAPLPAQIHLFGQRSGATSRTVAMLDVSGPASSPVVDVRVAYADGTQEERSWALASGGIWIVRATLDHAKPVERVTVGYHDAARPASSSTLQVSHDALDGPGAVYNEQAVYARAAQQTLAFAYLLEGPPGTRVLDHWSYRGLGGVGVSWWGVSHSNVARAAWTFTNPGVALTGIDVRYGWTTSDEPAAELSAQLKSGAISLPCIARSGELPPAGACDIP